MTEHVPAAELRVGDWPIGIAGWRPVRKIKVHPRLGTVTIWTDDQRHTNMGGAGRSILVDTPILTKRG